MKTIPDKANLYISSGDNSTSYLIDWLIEHSDEAGPYESYDNILNLDYDGIRQLNGKHPIYGAIECFEQSEQTPDWYSRESARYSWISE